MRSKQVEAQQQAEKLAAKMTTVGYVWIVFGILSMVAGILDTNRQGRFSLEMESIIEIAIGIWTLKTASNSKAKSAAHEEDTQKLVAVIKQVRRLYDNQLWLLIVGWIVIVVGDALILMGRV